MNETGTPQPGPMGANGTATAQPLEGLASASCSAPTPQPPVDNAHVAPGCQQFTGMKMSYAVEQRLRMVDFLLAQYGDVKRAVSSRERPLGVRSSSDCSTCPAKKFCCQFPTSLPPKQCNRHQH